LEIARYLLLEVAVASGGSFRRGACSESATRPIYRRRLHRGVAGSSLFMNIAQLRTVTIITMTIGLGSFLAESAHQILARKLLRMGKNWANFT
jgi:hypothetical protein